MPSSLEGGVEDEGDLIKALGIGNLHKKLPPSQLASEEEEEVTESEYEIIHNPIADEVDLSDLRGTTVVEAEKKKNDANDSQTELENLAELLPDVKARRNHAQAGGNMTLDNVAMPDIDEDTIGELPSVLASKGLDTSKKPFKSTKDTDSSRRQQQQAGDDDIKRSESMYVHESREIDDISKLVLPPGHNFEAEDYHGRAEASSGGHGDDDTFGDYPDSEHALEEEDAAKISKEFINMNSGQSVSTATQTHEVRMPMALPSFKPATGCTNASDFIVRCFVARLRAGVTVVKHGRSRWCKSRLRVLHIHPDGRSLTWKPAEGEPNSSKRPPKLDLSTCLEVRHAWSPDPQNPMYTGTPILRQKCEAANAHKSFALIFKHRTVDVTAVTADQCKVLMEGFSALCFRLQVANLAGRSGAKKGHARPMPEEDGVSTTASATLTNSSTPRGRP